ncbi:SacI domain and endonuclease/exonuclease/phosphatase [Colletotrichum karsti]|uniref:phosphoinositide 5-phosphatase n=1 Tax=Colletotrichum karsti TaxID=1095194 RepID=A0A9P6IHH6_9PEZI|nr:SacI domain and endonuclease/exonuclease/phosphatase [Colletotrichum karsti]KAF9879070.1 SacI domain and endonuclease/exonuclease/phosphatase [Colletotrichum karsti]
MDYASAFSQVPAPEKSSKLYIRDYPHRAVAIVSSSHALIFRYNFSSTGAAANGSLTSLASTRSRPNGGDGAAAKCMVEFTQITKKTLADYRPLTPRPIFGTLGLISVDGDVFLSVVTHATRVATLRPGETVERIASVAFFCLNNSEWDDVVSLDPLESESDVNSVYGQNLRGREVTIEHPCTDLRKLLGNGTFYYSTDFDLTNRLQDRTVNTSVFDIDNFDDSFLWNSFMISPLVQFRSRLLPQERDALDHSRFLTSAIRGFCRTMAIPQTSAPLRTRSTGLPSYLTVISRLSSRRAGTRFNSRGIDDDGNVANFVETETIYWSPGGTLFSYAQVRGSVPLFWEQTAELIPGKQNITVIRSPEGAQPAFNKHFDDLERAYGAVHVVNLLSEGKPGEAQLSQLYHLAVQHCPLSQVGEDESQDHALLRETHYDFHAETKGPGGYEAARQIRRYIETSTDGFAYYLAEEADDAGPDTDSQGSPRMVVVLQQEGVFRTNCLDCLDRTNLIQTLISQMATEAFLGHRGEYATQDFWMRHSTLWADNGDALSKIYAGTGALKSSFTRTGKMSLAGAVADMRKSVQRLYHNNFTDSARQTTIDRLLGRLVNQTPVLLFDPISDYVSGELMKRTAEFSSSQDITMLVGTFNLNGRTEGVDNDLSLWLCPEELGDVQPEIVAVGFQEIVELSPQQIMNSDPSRKQLWESAVRRCLNQRAQSLGGERYVLLRSGQLVGAALCIFVKASSLAKIKNVEGSVKKTGLSGMAGNKGAVAIRFDFANTHICFVTAHLAAGFSNYDERNRDYATIHHGLRFQRNRGIDDHDTVVWLGDFNYRIGLTSEAVRGLVKKRDLDTLYENDQLNLQMIAGLAFPFYSEARINFLPTYKFDLGTDEYDTSEKARIPAWTDRILRKGSNLRQLAYNSAPLKFSDHRPVYAVFQCNVSIVDEGLRDRISQELYQQRKAEVGDSIANLDSEETDDEDLIGYEAIEPGLPPASSDRQKWWLENKQAARVDIKQPKAPEGHATVLNPNRPPNPFTPTAEPDWVNVPRSRLSSFSSVSTSPYEHVYASSDLSSSATSATARRLPPPYDPSAMPAKIGRLNIKDEKSSQRGETPPPPPPPRRQTGVNAVGQQAPLTMNQAPLIPSNKSQTAPPSVPRPSSAVSQSSQQSKGKPAPPVAKKPAHLAKAPAASNGNGYHDDDPSDRPPLPVRAATGLSTTSSTGSAGVSRKPVGTPANPPPKRAGTFNVDSARQSPMAGAVALPGMRPSEARPKPQIPAKIQRKPAPVDLLDSLGEDNHSDMGSWETLVPSTQK